MVKNDLLERAIPQAIELAAVDTTDHWVRRAMALSWFTITYNVLEGLVSMGFGAAEESMALFGFGADSFIEVASATLVLWRFRKERGVAVSDDATREKTATLGIGVLFLLLSAGTAAGAGLQLWSGTHPATTLPGVVISTASLSFMFFLWRAKLRAANALNSSTMKGDAACSFACIKLSIVLLAGSVIYALAPTIWWSDAVAALVLSCFIGREGWGIVSAARKNEVPQCCGCGPKGTGDRLPQ